MRKRFALIVGTVALAVLAVEIGKTIAAKTTQPTCSGAGVGSGSRNPISGNSTTLATGNRQLSQSTPTSNSGAVCGKQPDGMRSANPESFPKDLQGELRRLLTTLHQTVRDCDFAALSSVQGKIATYLADDPRKALELVECFKCENDPLSQYILVETVLASARCVKDSVVASEILAIACSDADANHRTEALRFLGEGGPGGIDVEGQLLAVVQSRAEPEIRMATIVALQQRADAEASAGERLNPEFLKLANLEENPQVRLQALQAFRVRMASDEQIRTVGDFLHEGQDIAVGILTAEELGSVPEKSQMVGLLALQEGYRRDSQVDVRRACVKAMARVGRMRAVNLLIEIRDVDAGLVSDIDDYVSILRSGEEDFDRLLQKKSRLEQARASQGRSDDLPPNH